MLELSTCVIVLTIVVLLIILSAIALWDAFRQDRGVSSDGSFAGERSCEVSGFEALDCHCRPQLKLFQNSSSRLTLVLWPAMTIERFETEDFTASLPRK